MNLLKADVRAQRRYRLSDYDPMLKPYDIRPLACAMHYGFLQGIIDSLGSEPEPSATMHVIT
jgi:hypothetical protein